MRRWAVSGGAGWRVTTSDALLRTVERAGGKRPRTRPPASAASEDASDAFPVLPHLALRRGVSEEISRVVSGHQNRVAIFVLAPAQTGDRLETSQQRLRSKLAERDHHLRFDDVDLPEQEWLALLHLVRFRVAIARRAAL